jgi:hypothetical protein
MDKIEKNAQIKKGSEVETKGPFDLTQIASSKNVGADFAA